jgi:XRE family transcriptional regulator, regulator of sulfur utilization
MIIRRNLIGAAAAIAATAAVVALAQSAVKPMMRSAAFNWAAFKAEPTKTGSRRACFDAPTATLARLECHITTLNPGETPHAAHQHPDEEVIIIKEGELAVMQNGQTNRVEAGGIIFQAANEWHGLRNPGTNPAVYYVIKFVPRDLTKTGAP